MAKAPEHLWNVTAFGVVPLFDALHWLDFAANPSSGWRPVFPRSLCAMPAVIIGNGEQMRNSCAFPRHAVSSSPR